MPQQLAKRRRKGVNTKKRHRKKWEGVGQYGFTPCQPLILDAVLFAENVLSNCNSFKCKFLLILIKDSFCWFLCACACLSVERSDTDLYMASTRLNAIYLFLKNLNKILIIFDFRINIWYINNKRLRVVMRYFKGYQVRGQLMRDNLI